MRSKKARTSEKISMLVSHLVQNHLRISVEQNEWEQVVRKNFRNVQQSRVIVVVGAGASVAAGLPLATQALKELKAKSNLHRDTLDAELNRLETVYRLNRKNFETMLLALSTNVLEAQKLRKQLSRMYGHRYCPLLSYEILAHMFKHRFVDAIINFNFDELLDQCIADELNPDEYVHILSDGDCPDDLTMNHPRFRLPFYIKPHGTAGHQSTMRFTRDDYYGLPMDIYRVISNLLKDQRTVIISIGFEMQSFEFNLLANKAEKTSKLFYLNIKRPKPEPALSATFSEHFIKLSPKDGLDSLMITVWKEIEKRFKSAYTPRSIARHKLISHMFSGEKRLPQSDLEISNYLHNRTLIELCLAAAKGKGLINMQEIAMDRTGRYFELLRDKTQERINVYQMCSKIGLAEIGYSREAFRLLEDGGEEKSEILSPDSFLSLLTNFHGKVKAHLLGRMAERFDEKLFKKTMMKLYKSREVEIRFKSNNTYDKIFDAPEVLPTETSFTFETYKMLKQKDWKFLLVVAETGEWLTKPLIEEAILRGLDRNPENRIFLVVADKSWQDELLKRFPQKQIHIANLAWWEHNKHTTITINQNMQPTASIYFIRRLRSSNIVPLLLDQMDSQVAMEAFIAYWRKAHSQMPAWISASETKKYMDFFKRLNKNK